MKKIISTVIILMFTGWTFATQLVLVPSGSEVSSKKLFQTEGLSIHYYNEQFVIASFTGSPASNYIVLDNNAWSQSDQTYYLLRFDEQTRESYMAEMAGLSQVLYFAG